MSPVQDIETVCDDFETGRAEQCYNAQAAESEVHYCSDCALCVACDNPGAFACLRELSERSVRGRFKGYQGEVYVLPFGSCAEEEDCGMWEPWCW